MKNVCFKATPWRDAVELIINNNGVLSGAVIDRSIRFVDLDNVYFEKKKAFPFFRIIRPVTEHISFDRLSVEEILFARWMRGMVRPFMSENRSEKSTFTDLRGKKGIKVPVYLKTEDQEIIIGYNFYKKVLGRMIYVQSQLNKPTDNLIILNEED